jgi:hypothetical protein
MWNPLLLALVLPLLAAAACEVDTAQVGDDGLDVSGYEPSCEVVMGTCMCDGAPADPQACGCDVNPKGVCYCRGVDHPPTTCEPAECGVNPSAHVCECGGVAVDPDFCGCHFNPPLYCECAGQVYEWTTCCTPEFPAC